jgi:hypothetical protein
MYESAMNITQQTQTRLDGLRCALARDRPKYFNKITPQYLAGHLTSVLGYFSGDLHKMANKKSSAQSNWNKIEFINVTLTEPQKKEFKVWAKEQSPTIADELGQVMVDEYRLSLVWDDNNQCFIATFTGKQDQSTNADKALSSRSDDWYEALALTLYKHKVLFNGKTWNGESTKNNWG